MKGGKAEKEQGHIGAKGEDTRSKSFSLGFAVLLY